MVNNRYFIRAFIGFPLDYDSMLSSLEMFEVIYIWGEVIMSYHDFLEVVGIMRRRRILLVDVLFSFA